MSKELVSRELDFYYKINGDDKISTICNLKKIDILNLNLALF